MINAFEGEYAFLSNFYFSPMIIRDVAYTTNEHFFQAMKTFDPKERQDIVLAPTPRRAKYLGRKVSLRKDWEDIKEEVMLIGLRHKFSNPDLRRKLLATGNEELIEGTTWHDKYWGICNCETCGGQGKNRLGKLLMQVREELAD
jgi:ribA/ribD-fused uncharacterized protein